MVATSKQATAKMAFAFADATLKACPVPGVIADVSVDVDEPGARVARRVGFYESRCEASQRPTAWAFLLGRAGEIEREAPYNGTVQVYCKSRGGIPFVFVVDPASEWPAIKAEAMGRSLAKACGVEN
jgi:hypothetical protein